MYYSVPNFTIKETDQQPLLKVNEQNHVALPQLTYMFQYVWLSIKKIEKQVLKGYNSRFSRPAKHQKKVMYVA